MRVAARPLARASGGRLDTATAETLLELTREMAAAADADDWERVTRQDVARRALLEGAPGEPLEPASDTLAAALLAADRDLLARARAVRDTRGEEAHQTRVERTARGSYASVMRCGDGRGEGHAR